MGNGLVLVTGATGHVGNTMIRTLLDAGRPVRAMVLPGEDITPIKHLPIEIIHGDVTQPESLDHAFKGVEVVYHFAALISVLSAKSVFEKMLHVNVGGTQNVIAACLKHSISRLVHCSSSEVLYDKPLGTPVDENRPFVPNDHPMPYAITKAKGEQCVRDAIAQQGLNAIIIYPTGVIGPYNYQLSLTTQMIAGWLNGKKDPLLDGGYNFIDVRDLCAGALLAEQKATTGSRYLFSGHWESIENMAKIVSQSANVSIPTRKISIKTLRRLAPIVEFATTIIGAKPILTKAQIVPLTANPEFSNRKAQTELGWQPRPFKKTIEDLVDWLKKERLVKLS